MSVSEHQQRLQTVATVTRISSIVSAHFSRVTRYEDAFPADATVQSAWRELGGGTSESPRRVKWRGSVVRLEEAAPLHQVPIGAAVSEALRSITLISDSWDTPGAAMRAAQGHANRIAEIFDAESLVDASVLDSWISYESGCAERIAAMIGGEDVFTIRLEAGMQSMPYRRAVLDLPDM